MTNCEMNSNCQQAVTHIGSKGFLYCADHATTRRQSGYEQARKLRPWEIRWVNEGRPLPSYKPGPEPKSVTA